MATITSPKGRYCAGSGTSMHEKLFNKVDEETRSHGWWLCSSDSMRVLQRIRDHQKEYKVAKAPKRLYGEGIVDQGEVRKVGKSGGKWLPRVSVCQL